MDSSCNSIKLFCANYRSVKRKHNDLSALTIDYDLICLTDIHVDHTISDRSIVNRDDLVLFRKDRNINGGGVLVAVTNLLFPREIKPFNCNSEVLFVRIKECIIVCCYYRPYQGDEIANFVEVFNQIVELYAGDQLILTGDMNFPGFDWQNTIKCGTACGTLHVNFQYFLNENYLVQVTDVPTHVKGNTHDLVCTNSEASVVTDVMSGS